MADKTFHSIKFLGLPDTYKIPDIVNEHSPSSAYAVGDYVTKDGKTYKCTTAIASSGEAWNTAHWTEVKVGNDLQGEVADLKSAISYVNAQFEPIYTVKSRITESGTASNYKLLLSGSSQSDTKYKILKYYVHAGRKYWLKVPEGTIFQYQNAWNVPTGTNTGLVGTPCNFSYNGVITIPEGASYIMVSVSASDTTSGLYGFSTRYDSLINRDSKLSISGDSPIYLEKDTANSNLYLYMKPSWYLRGALSKTFSLAQISSFLTVATSPNGVENCVVIPFGESLYYDMANDSLVVGNYSNVNLAENLQLAYISTSGKLLEGAIYRRYLYEHIGATESGNAIVPEYFNSQLTTKITSINSNIASVGKDGFTMAFVTDSHLKYNSGNTSKLIKYLNGYTNMKYVFHGGDIIDVEPTKEKALDKLAGYVGSFNYLNHPMFTIIGNHDYNTETSSAVVGEDLTISDFYGVAMRQMNGIVIYDEYYDYYFIDSASNTAVICLQTGVNNGSYHVNQNDALAQILPNMPDNVIIIGHLFCKTVDGNPTLNANFNTLMNGNSLHPGLNSMTGREKVKCIVTGHTHYDWTTFSDGIRVIVTDTDSYKANTSNKDTVNELAFDVMTFDFDNDSVSCIRIGRGNDRTISLSS